MPHMYQLEVNAETEEALLYQCVSGARLSSDPNLQKKGGEAQAELERRERAYKRKRFNLESEERVKAQKFQEAQTNKQLSSTEKLGEKQLRIAKFSAFAAGASAVAALVLAYLAWSSPPN